MYCLGVRTDERTVAIVDTAARSPNASVMAKAARFFLGIEERMAEDKRRKDDNKWTDANTVDYHKHSNKTVKRARRVVKDVKIRAKAQKKRELAGMEPVPAQVYGRTSAGRDSDPGIRGTGLSRQGI
uniref:SDA1 N-terminal domain-containing protein n=1 Tax=Pseudictyota dubia TaxID=2749911 RepID=A0A7R9W3Q8_9STRA